MPRLTVVCSYLFRKLWVRAAPPARGHESGESLVANMDRALPCFNILIAFFKTGFLANNISWPARQEVRLCRNRSRIGGDFNARRARGLRGRSPQQDISSRVIQDQAALVRAQSSEIVRS